MFPTLDIDKIASEENQNVIQPGGKAYKYDFKKGDFVIKDGRLVEVEGKEAIKIWIEKILRTEKFKFKIYEEYGVGIGALTKGKKIPFFFIQSELKREITESLKKHPEINNIEGFKLEQNSSLLTISFKVDLKDGEYVEMEVNINGK